MNSTSDFSQLPLAPLSALEPQHHYTSNQQAADLFEQERRRYRNRKTRREQESFQKPSTTSDDSNRAEQPAALKQIGKPASKPKSSFGNGTALSLSNSEQASQLLQNDGHFNQDGDHNDLHHANQEDEETPLDFENPHLLDNSIAPLKDSIVKNTTYKKALIPEKSGSRFSANTEEGRPCFMAPPTKNSQYNKIQFKEMDQDPIKKTHQSVTIQDPSNYIQAKQGSCLIQKDSQDILAFLNMSPVVKKTTPIIPNPEQMDRRPQANQRKCESNPPVIKHSPKLAVVDDHTDQGETTAITNFKNFHSSERTSATGSDKSQPEDFAKKEAKFMAQQEPMMSETSRAGRYRRRGQRSHLSKFQPKHDINADVERLLGPLTQEEKWRDFTNNKICEIEAALEADTDLNDSTGDFFQKLDNAVSSFSRISKPSLLQNPTRKYRRRGQRRRADETLSYQAPSTTIKNENTSRMDDTQVSQFSNDFSVSQMSTVQQKLMASMKQFYDKPATAI